MSKKLSPKQEVTKLVHFRQMAERMAKANPDKETPDADTLMKMWDFAQDYKRRYPTATAERMQKAMCFHFNLEVGEPEEDAEPEADEQPETQEAT